VAGGGAIEGNAADDALMVDQGLQIIWTILKHDDKYTRYSDGPELLKWPKRKERSNNQHVQ
jgi:hypothetical protein